MCLILSLLVIAAPKFRHEVSISRRSRDAVLEHLGLVSVWRKFYSWSCLESKTKGLGLGPQRLVGEVDFNNGNSLKLVLVIS